MMRWLTLLILLIPIPVIAQSDDTMLIVADETLAVTISAEMRGILRYVVEDEPEIITIEALAVDDFDPVVWIIDSQGRLFAYNDNVDDRLSAYIENLFLPPDTYTIYIDSFNGVTDGTVDVLLAVVSPFEEVISNDGRVITIRATLPQDMTFRYALSVSDGDAWTITVRDTSNSLDPYVAIYAADGELLIANDDHLSVDLSLNTLDARIHTWQPTEAGVVFIDVRDFLGHAGEFELLISDVAVE